MEYWSISHNITQPDSMPRSNPDQESLNNAFQFHLGTFLFLSGLNGVLPTCRRTTNSHMSLTERRIGIHHKAAYAHTSKLRWLNSPPLPPRQVLARAYHDAANLRPPNLIRQVVSHAQLPSWHRDSRKRGYVPQVWHSDAETHQRGL